MDTYWTKPKPKLRVLNRNATSELPKNNFILHIVNDGGRLNLYIDGVSVEAKDIKDFTLECHHYNKD